MKHNPRFFKRETQSESKSLVDSLLPPGRYREVLHKCREGEGSLAELQQNVDDLSAFLAKYTAKTKEIHELKMSEAEA